jgi:hypothetical protein
MKSILCVTATAALLAFGSVSHARGTPTSSFVPKGPEPHSSLSDKHHSRKGSRAGGQGVSHKGAHNPSPKTGSHSAHTPHTN